jgi:hypothetical protein
MYTQFLEGEVGTKVSDKNIEPCLLLIAEELTSTKGSCSDDELRPLQEGGQNINHKRSKLTREDKVLSKR